MLFISDGEVEMKPCCWIEQNIIILRVNKKEKSRGLQLTFVVVLS